MAKPEDDVPVTRGGRLKLVAAGVAVVAAVAAGIVLLGGGGSGGTDPMAEPTTEAPTIDLGTLERPDTPERVTIRPSGKDWVVSWSVDGAVTPHYWLVIRKDAFVAADALPTYTTAPTLRIRGLKAGQRPCLNVAAGVTKSNQWSAPTRDICGPT